MTGNICALCYHSHLFVGVHGEVHDPEADYQEYPQSNLFLQVIASSRLGTSLLEGGG